MKLGLVTCSALALALADGGSGDGASSERGGEPRRGPRPAGERALDLQRPRLGEDQMTLEIPGPTLASPSRC